MSFLINKNKPTIDGIKILNRNKNIAELNPTAFAKPILLSTIIDALSLMPKSANEINENTLFANMTIVPAQIDDNKSPPLLNANN